MSQSLESLDSRFSFGRSCSIELALDNRTKLLQHCWIRTLCSPVLSCFRCGKMTGNVVHLGKCGNFFS